MKFVKRQSENGLAKFTRSNNNGRCTSRGRTRRTTSATCTRWTRKQATASPSSCSCCPAHTPTGEHPLFTTSPHHAITPPRHHTTTPRHHFTTKSPHRDTTMPSDHHAITPPHRKPPRYHTTTPQHHHTTPSHYQTTNHHADLSTARTASLSWTPT